MKVDGMPLFWQTGFCPTIREASMSRIFSLILATLTCGAVSWIVVGSIAAAIGSARNSREGAAAMGGFFIIGGLAGIVGLIGGAILSWWLTSDAARIPWVVGGSLSALAVLVIGVMIAMQPKYDPGIVWPDGTRGEAQVEVRMPKANNGAGKLHFDLRCGGYSLSSLAGKVREEDGQTIVPGAFRLEDRQRTWIFAVMGEEKQLGTETIEFEKKPNEATDWSAWRPMEGGVEMRWRVAVVPK
jgi:MFS family permease